jgi:hypothetical protein
MKVTFLYNEKTGVSDGHYGLIFERYGVHISASRQTILTEASSWGSVVPPAERRDTTMPKLREEKVTLFPKRAVEAHRCFL